MASRAWRWFMLLGNDSCYSARIHAARRWFMLLGDGTRCSSIAHNYSTTHHGDWTMSWTARLWFAPARTSSKRCCTTGTRRSGTSCGGYDPGYPWRTTWAAPQGRPSPQDEALRGMTLLGASLNTQGRYPEDTMRSVRIRMIP